jgi:hypothetical protein
MKVKSLFIERKFAVIFLTVITSIVFFPTFFNEFQYGWDDQWQVLEYEFVTSNSFNDLLYHFTHFHLGQYMPVNTLLYVIIYKFFGFNPTAFHVASLIIHVSNVLLVFAIVSKTIKRVKPIWTLQRVQLFSFLTALIFAIHPFQVESVAWISASKIVLYTLFFLLGILLYLQYLETFNIWYFVGVVICYLSAYGSKEQAIIFPLNLLAFDYIFNRYINLKVSFVIFSNRVVLEKIPFLIIFFLLYWFSAANNLGSFNFGTYPLYQRLIFSMSSFMEYIFRFIAPVKLYYFYFFPIEIGETLPLYYWGYPLLTFICVLFIWHNYRRNNRIVIFGFLLFAINILLVLHLIPMPRKMITADRYMYFSIIGMATITVWFAQYLYVKLRNWHKMLTSAIVMWFIFLGVQSFIRTTEWKDSDSIKRNIYELIEKRKANNEPIVNDPIKQESDETR